MLALLCIAALATTALGSPSGVFLGSKAIGADIPASNYMIHVSKSWFGTLAPGALIADKFAITSASLLGNTPAKSLTVRVGAYWGPSVKVAKVLVHPDASLGVDIAVLELEEPLPAKSASPVGLVGPGGAPPGSLASAASWGWVQELNVHEAWVVLPKYCAGAQVSPSPSPGLCATGSFRKGSVLSVGSQVVGLAATSGARSDLVSYLDLADPSVQKFIAAATAQPLPTEAPTEAPVTDPSPSSTTSTTSTEAPTEAPTATPDTEAPTTAPTDEPSSTTEVITTKKPNPSGKTCQMHVNGGLPTSAPIILKDSDVLEFRDPDNADALVLDAGERVRLVCPGAKNGFKLDKTKQLLVAECVEDDGFRVAGKAVSLNQLGCKTGALSSARASGNCGAAGQFSRIQIGFEVGSGFITQIDNCFDRRTFDAVYSRMTLSPAVAGHESGVKRPQFTPAGFYENINPNALFNRNHQIAAIGQLLGEDASKYIHQSGDDYFLARGHLSAKADYVLGAQQRATFYYVNAAPQWQTFNGDNWEKLESSVRAWVISSQRTVEVITGTWGTATLPNKDGVETELFLEADKKYIRVPKYYWKIVYDPKTKEGVAFVGLNNPHRNVTDEDVFCKGDCSRYSWLSWAANNQKSGVSFCCDVSELKKVVSTVPADVEVQSIL